MPKLRRIKVNELLGNFDAHLKNFGLLYEPGHAQPALSPAYDIVAYGTYLPGSGHALQLLPEQASRTLLTPMTVRRLANLWAIPEKQLSDAVADCVDRACALGFRFRSEFVHSGCDVEGGRDGPGRRRLRARCRFVPEAISMTDELRSRSDFAKRDYVGDGRCGLPAMGFVVVASFRRRSGFDSEVPLAPMGCGGVVRT